MRRSLTTLLALIVIIGGGFAAWYFLAGPGSNKTSSNTSTTATNPSAEQQIRANWIKFFNGKTSAQQRISLLENGDQFAQVIQGMSQSATAQQTSATISNVKLGNSATTASVTYTIELNGKPVLNNQQGTAVLQNGTWKVSDAAFCQLLQLSGTAPPNCPSGSGQAQSQSSSAGTGANSQTNSPNTANGAPGTAQQATPTGTAGTTQSGGTSGTNPSGQ